MAKLNTGKPSTGATSPVKAVSSHASTYEGGAGFVSDDKSEVYRLGLTLMAGGESTFYESGSDRDERFNSLIQSVAVSDPSWIYGFLTYLRSEGNIRTASIMGAANAVHARLANPSAVQEDELLSSLGTTGVNRALVRDVCQRADEPGEFAAYYMKTFGTLPKAAKRGLADAANLLYNEYSVMKYDTAGQSGSNKVRFADILNLTHASPKFVPATWQIDKADAEDGLMEFFTNGNVNKGLLFQHIINRRFDVDEDPGFMPEMILHNKNLRLAVSKGSYDILLDASVVKAAGMTWEDVLSLAGSHLPKDKVWEAVIPSMGYMALMRNLRNFEEAGISRESRDYVIAFLSDPKKVAKSKQLPFRFMSAYESVNGDYYRPALSDGLNYSTQNIPELDGETLVLVDLSQSMQSPVSNKSKMTVAKQAALFGAAVAMKNHGHAQLVAFATTDKVIDVPGGGSVLNIASEMDAMSRAGYLGGGTETGMALQKHFSGHKRVLIFTDGQSVGHNRNFWISGYSYGGYNRNIRELITDKTYLYGWDLRGYKVMDIPAGANRTHQFTGLADSDFRMIPLLEKGQSQDWPWLKK